MFLSSSFHLFLFCTQGPHAKNERVPPEFFCISEFLIQTSTVCNNEMSIFFSFIFTLFLLFKSEIKSQSIFRVERYLLSSKNLISFVADISDQKSKCKQIKGSDVPQDRSLKFEIHNKSKKKKKIQRSKYLLLITSIS